MRAFLKAVIYTLGGAGVLFSLLIFLPLIGGIGGWVFAWVFDDSFAALMRMLHWEATGFQAGAALGFLSGFIKASLSTGSK